MRIDALSTFPGMFDSVMGESMMKRACMKGILEFNAFDLRDWTHDVHRTTDDSPYGGGAGLVMKCEPLFEAVEDIAADGTPPYVIFMAPHGKVLTDSHAAELSGLSRLMFVCGHYEGIDERAYALADEVMSIGDYVLTGGELASMVAIDAIVRKIPGVLGADGGADEESFADGLLEHSQFTRPASFRGMEVPEILLSGNHGEIDRWRRRDSLQRTSRLRPDLIEKARREGRLSPADEDFLNGIA